MSRLGLYGQTAILQELSDVSPSSWAAELSLHTADPGTTGAHEDIGDGGYSRPSVSWNQPYGNPRQMVNSSSVMFSLGGSTAVSYFGTWDTTNHFIIGGALSSAITSTSVTFAAGAITIYAT